MDKHRRGAYKELEQRIDRAQQMAKVTANLALQRHLLGKGQRHKVKARGGGDGGDDDADDDKDAAPVYKWRKERKH